MTFISNIYTPNPKKIKEDRLSLFYLGAIILGLVLVFVLVVRGVFALLFLASIAGGLIKLKIEDIKKKGANRFGSLPYLLKLSPEMIVIGSREYKTEELTDLTIEADDFTGGPGGDIFSSSLGTDNFLKFTHAGEKHSYQFVVKKQSDLSLVAQIEKEIHKAKASV